MGLVTYMTQVRCGAVDCCGNRNGLCSWAATTLDNHGCCIGYAPIGRIAPDVELTNLKRQLDLAESRIEESKVNVKKAIDAFASSGASLAGTAQALWEMRRDGYDEALSLIRRARAGQLEVEANA